MRIGFGFIALLIGVGLYLWLSADNAIKVTQASKPARAAAEEVAGVGMRESFDVEKVESNGRVTGLRITRLDLTGPLAKMYSIKEGDVIIEVGPFGVRDTDIDMVKAQLWELGMRQHKITILRGSEKIELDNHGDAAQLGGKERQPGGNLNPMAIPSH